MNVILAHSEIYSYLATPKLRTKVLELPQFCAAALGSTMSVSLAR